MSPEIGALKVILESIESFQSHGIILQNRWSWFRVGHFLQDISSGDLHGFPDPIPCNSPNVAAHHRRINYNRVLDLTHLRLSPDGMRKSGGNYELRGELKSKSFRRTPWGKNL